MILLIKVNFIIKKQGCKKYMLVVLDFSSFKIIFRLLIKVIILYIQVFIT